MFPFSKHDFEKKVGWKTFNVQIDIYCNTQLTSA